VAPGILELIGGSVGLVSSCLTLKPAYVVGESVEITVESDGNCQEARLDWGDFQTHIPFQTLSLTGQTSATYTHAYTTPGVKTVQVVGTVGCVGMGMTHVLVIPPSPAPATTPQVTQFHGPGSSGGVLPYGYYLITGSGFGTQMGEVHMLGSFPGAWWQGPQNPYPGPWGPIPGGVLLNTFYWSSGAIGVYVPFMTGVQDQTVQLVVKRPSSNGFTSSAPFSTPFVALQDTRNLDPEDVTVNCGPLTRECQLAGYAWAMSVSKNFAGPGPPVTGTDTLQVQVENGWALKSMEAHTFNLYGSTISSPTGFTPGASSATIQVAYSLIDPTCSVCYEMGHRVGLTVQGPLGVPHKGPYPSLSVPAVSQQLTFPLSLDVRKALDDLEARLLALEQRRDTACPECAARRHTVQVARASVLALRVRLADARADSRVHEALRRHAVYLAQEVDRMEARFPRDSGSWAGGDPALSPRRQNPPTGQR
jgi:hypothetical protein